MGHAPASTSADVADIDTVKAATTARTFARRIVCEDVISVG